MGLHGKPLNINIDDQPTTPLKLDDASASWDVLASFMERFLEQWESEALPPRVIDFLPDEPGVFRRMVLIELIKIDMEYRRQRNCDFLRLEDYHERFPELARPDGMPTDLIFEEYHVRKTSGEEVDLQEYGQRFPSQADAIVRLFKLDANTVTTSLSDGLAHSKFSTGERVGDFYLMSSLGAGAFGSVFLARQEAMQRLVALKISMDKGTEAQTLAQLDHPNIVRVYDQMRMPGQNLRLLYMQFVAGGTLQSIIREGNRRQCRDAKMLAETIAETLDQTGVVTAQNVPLKSELVDRPWSEVTCRIGMELASALHYAHEQGILHRDVKPANVLLEANGTAKLADFNISFSSQLEGTSPAAYFGGSLAYMSPEQLEACHPEHTRQASDLDGRSDVFSLGVMLWELLFGTRPFGDEELVGSWRTSLLGMAELRREQIPQPKQMPTDDVGRRLLAILQRCIKPEPRDRYQTAELLARDLGMCLEPRVAQLQQSSKRGLMALAARHPVIACIIAGIGPNAIAGFFNYVYNDQAIIRQLEGTNAFNAFWNVQFVINGTAFPLATIVGVWYLWPMVKGLRQVNHRQPPTDLLLARRRAFRLGRFVSYLGIIEWSIAGIAFPVALHILLGGLERQWYFHFVGSLLICGMIAAAYPFFFLSTLAIRAFVPPMFEAEPMNKLDVRELRWMSRHMDWFLYLAGGVPAAGVMLLLVAGHMEDPHSSLALKVLSAAGAIGFGFALSLSRSVHADITALLKAAELFDDTRDSDRN
ncbi:serine/threonine-protein kinase [Blastopirellula retiformator]|uniref:non-specific serine/threonine protein kinase n=1 Tax=Blastopirellula retiformator TaxID=2527970 RepID=A0A5C5V8P6_9BACT|nr:serine/threonine-protein kinase [Blastopirellula retiformator]TWT34343.1 Serine/threonine-protein kinase PrkC [Blastopirellula retiformator]